MTENNPRIEDPARCRCGHVQGACLLEPGSFFLAREWQDKAEEYRVERDALREELAAIRDEWGDVATPYEEDYLRLQVENERLREALETLARWTAVEAQKHGHIGFREFARTALEPTKEGE